MKSSIDGVVKLLKRDKKYKRLLESFNTLSIYNIPREELVAEIKSIHQLREIRRLSPKDDRFIDKLVIANTHDQAQRSRLTEIMMNCVHVTLKLEAAIEAMRQYFLVEYSDHLRQFRTKEERLTVMNIALRKFTQYLEEVAYVKELASLVVSDIDRGSWSLRSSIEALKIHSAREVNV